MNARTIGRLAIATCIVIVVSFVATEAVKRLHSQAILAPRVPRHTIQKVTTFESNGATRVQIIENRRFPDGSLYTRIIPDGDEGTLVVNNVSAREGFDIDLKTKKFHRWTVTDRNPFVMPLNKVCKANVMTGSNVTVTGAADSPVFGYSTEKIIAVMRLNTGKTLTTIRVAAPDLECQEMLKETYVDSTLTSREQVISIEAGSQDPTSLQRPAWALETDPVDWLKSYLAVRELPSPHFPPGHPMAQYFN